MVCIPFSTHLCCFAFWPSSRNLLRFFLPWLIYLQLASTLVLPPALIRWPWRWVLSINLRWQAYLHSATLLSFPTLVRWYLANTTSQLLFSYYPTPRLCFFNFSMWIQYDWYLVSISIHMSMLSNIDQWALHVLFLHVLTWRSDDSTHMPLVANIGSQLLMNTGLEHSRNISQDWSAGHADDVWWTVSKLDSVGFHNGKTMWSEVIK